MALRIELVGLLPELLAPCLGGRCRWQEAGIDLEAALAGDYPAVTLANQQSLAETARSLLYDFGPRIDPVGVPLVSARGFWLSLRHQLRSDAVYVVIAGRRAVPLSAGYEAVRRAVAEALHTA